MFAWDCRNILGLHYTNLLIKMGLPGLSTRVGSFAFCWVSAWIRPSDAIEFSKNSTNDMAIELNSRSFLKFVVLFILKQCLRINASNPGKIMYKRLSLILLYFLINNVNTHKPNNFDTNRLLTFNESTRQIIVFLPSIFLNESGCTDLKINLKNI